MTLDEFIENLVTAIDLPNVTTISKDQSLCSIEDFDSLATLGVMTLVSMEFGKEIQGQWLWDEKITPQQLYDHVSK